MQGAYPNYNPQDKTIAVDVWLMALEEYSEKDVINAFKAYMKNNKTGFAPCPGQIVDEIYKTSKPEEMNAEQAWSLVNAALGNSAYEAAEEFAKLPPLVQEAIGQPNLLRTWGTDDNFNQTVVMSNFMRTYNTVLKRQEERDKLPPEMRRMIEKVNEGSHLSNLRERNRQSVIAQKEKQLLISANMDTKTGIEMPDRLQEEMNEQRREWEEMFSQNIYIRNEVEE